MENNSCTTEIDEFYEEAPVKISEKLAEETSLARCFKTNYRFLRKHLSAYFRSKDKNFKSVLYVSAGEIPYEYISAFRKQYPNKKFKVIMPINDISNVTKLSRNFEFFFQNKTHTATLYKFKANRENIEIYGLYVGNVIDNNSFKYKVQFAKAIRLVAEDFKSDIVHVENIPFFLGAEFEKHFPQSVKVLQIIDDFKKFEEEKEEPFWALINIAQKKQIKKLLSDKIVKKCMLALFGEQKGVNMQEFLEFIYGNYDKFRKQFNPEEDIMENILFKRLNARTQELFPQIAYEGELFYNPLFYTLKKVNRWVTISETYYEELFKNPELSEKMFERIRKTKSKGGFVGYGCEIKEKKPIYKEFTADNFRDYRGRNKKYLVREFSKVRIKTNFIDRKFFLDENYAVRGYLDSFYQSPLVFCKFSPSIFPEGADIALTIILKLFEQYKNIQFIVNIPDGLKNKNIQSWVEYLEKNSDADGKWVFIDGEINLPQFYAASDLTFLPSRENPISDLYLTAMRYGCIPVASKIGIYNDNIADIFDDMTLGCGFKTQGRLGEDTASFEDFFKVVTKALNLYNNNQPSWNILIENAMNHDSTWSFEVIEKYNQIYDRM